MRTRSLAISLCAALFLHAIAGGCLGILLGRMDSANAFPEFMKGLSSIELELVSVSRTDPKPVTPVVVTVEDAQLPEDNVEPEKKDPVAVTVADTGVQESSAVSATEVRPRYPFGSRIRGEEGMVILRVWIDSAGRASRTVVLESSGFSALDAAALKAIKRAVFRDAEGLLASSTETTVPIRFKLND